MNFRNAFDSLNRKYVLKAMANLVPILFLYCYIVYGMPLVLKYGDVSMLSQGIP